MVIFLVKKYLGCFKGRRPDSRCGRICSLHLLGNTEIPQLVLPEAISENVGRFDVTVNNMDVFTGRQCIAEV